MYANFKVLSLPSSNRVASPTRKFPISPPPQGLVSRCDFFKNKGLNNFVEIVCMCLTESRGPCFLPFTCLLFLEY